MTEKPILFSAPMVKAILDGRKTMTRRVLKPQPLPPVARWGVDGRWFIPQAVSDIVKQSYITTWPNRQGSRYGGVGDLIWVRENFADTLGMGFDKRYHYAADVVPGSESDQIRKDYGVRWKPSIHMPRAASRITLRVTAVKVERLQDISEEDAKAEGITSRVAKIEGYHGSEPATVYECEGIKALEMSAVDAFRRLWTSINGPGSWEANPWVAAYSFERVT